MQYRTFGSVIRQAKYGLAALCLVCARPAAAQIVVLDERDAEVWLRTQEVRGHVDGPITGGSVFVNGREARFEASSGQFAVSITLDEGLNVIVACAEGGACSDTLRWVLGYRLRPEIYAFATVSGNEVTLHARVLESPNGDVTSYQWSADSENPGAAAIPNAADSVVIVTFSFGAEYGEYFFDVTAVDEQGAQGSARTFVTVDSTGIHPFDISSDHASWVDRAVVYEVTPYIFHRNGKWRHVTERLDEIAALGVNTLWIQPVFEAQEEGPGTSGQGYGITNYFRVRSDLGTETDLRELVRTAKETYGMRVLFDFVPNHTSDEHRFAKDAIEHGTASHYHDFYLTERDDSPYSRFYRTKRAGKMEFLYYVWDKLVIIDYRNPEVYRWMMEAGRKWIEEFDIDGYRIDAVWGVNARTPEAMQNWRFDLKRIKPEIFLLGEDKATWPSSFEGRFDAAYDWFPEEGWVSHWSWQTDYSERDNRTIFNYSVESQRSHLLREALTNQGRGWHPDAKVFRFMENNDLPRFLPFHGLERTKMAAALLFTLPGIPMIYNGQEIGFERHPYETSQIFNSSELIAQQDELGLYEFYRDLVHTRSAFPALYSDAFEEIAVTPPELSGRTFAFRRWSGDENVVIAVNMGETAERMRLALPTAEMDLQEGQIYYVTDLLTGDYWSMTAMQLRFPVISVPGFTTRVLAISDEVIHVPSAVNPNSEIPEAISLDQNYPNPFNPATTISFSIPNATRISLSIFDVLGRQVRLVLDDVMPQGRHSVVVDGSGIPSGTYFYRLSSEQGSLIRQMTLIR